MGVKAMQELKSFRLVFVKSENHLVLPKLTSIVLVQNLYDVLFQYVIDAVREEALQKFIAQLESHIKSRSRTPFSAPVEELAFLDEGLEELRLLNWMEVPVMVFTLEMEGADDSEARDTIIEELSARMLLKPCINSDMLYLYPANITSY